MESIESRKTFILQRKAEITNRFGSNPRIYSSGRVIDYEHDFPKNMRININKKTIEQMSHKR